MYKMSKSFRNKSTTEAKSVNWREIVDIFNKKYKITDEDVEKAAKNTKKSYMTVKTRNLEEKDRKIKEDWYIRQFTTGYKAPVSDTDPNRAFRDRKKGIPRDIAEMHEAEMDDD